MRYTRTSEELWALEKRDLSVLQVLTKDKRAVRSPVLGKWCSEGGRELSGEAEKFHRTNPERSPLGSFRWQFDICRKCEAAVSSRISLRVSRCTSSEGNPWPCV